MPQVFLTAASGTWNVPAGIFNLASVECIGSGGSGYLVPSGMFGGGGGAYAKIANIAVTPAQPFSYQVSQAGGSVLTWWGSSSTVAADYGRNAVSGTAGVGGSAANSVGTTKFSGGSAAPTGSGLGGGGGGGAAGRNGAGANGLASPGGGPPYPGAAGATADAGAGGAGGAAGSGGVGSGAGGNGSPGNPGTEFDSSHGAGGGGGGGGYGTSAGGNGGAGGNYGGGGGGGADNSSTGGAGSPGLIVITYVLAPQPNTFYVPGIGIEAN